MGSYQLALFPCFWLKGLEKWNLTVDLHTALKGALACLCGCLAGVCRSHSLQSIKWGRKYTSMFLPQVLHCRQNQLWQIGTWPCLLFPSHSQYWRRDTLWHRYSDAKIISKSSIKGIQECVSVYFIVHISWMLRINLFCCSYLPDEWHTEKPGGFRLFPNGAK